VAVRSRGAEEAAASCCSTGRRRPASSCGGGGLPISACPRSKHTTGAETMALELPMDDRTTFACQDSTLGGVANDSEQMGGGAGGSPRRHGKEDPAAAGARGRRRAGAWEGGAGPAADPSSAAADLHEIELGLPFLSLSGGRHLADPSLSSLLPPRRADPVLLRRSLPSPWCAAVKMPAVHLPHLKRGTRQGWPCFGRSQTEAEELQEAPAPRAPA